jgi:general secretion pathway protein G
METISAPARVPATAGTGGRNTMREVISRGPAAAVAAACHGGVWRRHRAAMGAGGFTLIELMVVMTVIVVLASIGLAQYGNTVTRAKEAALKENLFQMRSALDQYYADKNKYPESLSALVEEKYIRAVPVDPFTNAADTWQETMAEPDPTNPSASSGIFDVKSGSDQNALDGTLYADW